MDDTEHVVANNDDKVVYNDHPYFEKLNQDN